MYSIDLTQPLVVRDHHKADALSAVKQFEQTLRYCRLTQVSVIQHAHHSQVGRPKRNRQPQSHRYHLQATLVPNSKAIEEQQRIAGRFILATSELECDALNAVEVLAEYKKQQCRLDCRCLIWMAETAVTHTSPNGICWSIRNFIGCLVD
jgi:hypothetical protein